MALCDNAAGGRVNKIGPDYVGLLVLGVFNAAIGRQNIRTDFVYQPLVRPYIAHTTLMHWFMQTVDFIGREYIGYDLSSFFWIVLLVMP